MMGGVYASNLTDITLQIEGTLLWSDDCDHWPTLKKKMPFLAHFGPLYLRFTTAPFLAHFLTLVFEMQKWIMILNWNLIQKYFMI